MVKYITGDATLAEPQTIIAHICNDVGGWGAGFTGALSKRYPEAENTYRNDSTRRLGTVQFVWCEQDVVIANMVAQRGYRSRFNPVAVDYAYLEDCLMEVKRVANEHSLTVQMPKIGAGLGGGDWQEIRDMLEYHFPENHSPQATVILLANERITRNGL